MRNFLKNVSFTKNESKVIIFIIAVLTAGFAIKYYKEVIKTDSGRFFDFSASDNEFRRRSEYAAKNKLHLNGFDSSVNVDSLAGSMEFPEDSLIKNEEPSTKFQKFFDLAGGSININTATREELVELPGVGEAIAEKIIIYRDENRGFKKIEDLMKVKGIGKKKFEKIKGFIKIQ